MIVVVYNCIDVILLYSFTLWFWALFTYIVQTFSNKISPNWDGENRLQLVSSNPARGAQRLPFCSQFLFPIMTVLFSWTSGNPGQIGRTIRQDKFSVGIRGMSAHGAVHCISRGAQRPPAFSGYITLYPTPDISWLLLGPHCMWNRIGTDYVLAWSTDITQLSLK